MRTTDVARLTYFELSKHGESQAPTGTCVGESVHVMKILWDLI